MDGPRATFHSIHPVDVRELRKCKQVPRRPYRTTPTLWPICEMGRGLPRIEQFIPFLRAFPPPSPSSFRFFSHFHFLSSLPPVFFRSIFLSIFYPFSPLQSFYFLSSILSLFYPQISPFVPLFRQPSTTIYSPREISTRIPRELGTREATKLADSDDWQIKFSVYRHDRKSEDR